MIRSLRMRLFAGVIAVSVVVLAILSVSIDAAVHHTLQAEFDRVLLEKARSLASMVEQSGSVTHFDYQPGQFPEFEPGVHCAYFEILLDGKPFQHSASLGLQHLPDAHDEQHVPSAQSSALPDGRRGRQLAMTFHPFIEHDDPGAILPDKLPTARIIVAQDRSGLDQTLSSLRLLLLSLCGGATMFSAVGLILATGRAIAPVGALAKRIESVGEHDLSAVLPSDRFPTELAPVVDRLNGLLARLAAAFARERGFTADVAHELRTPLAGLLATLEVARSRPREPEAYQVAIDKSLVILLQMQRLVENFLLLARAESGQLAVRLTEVNLADLLQESLRAFLPRAAEQGLEFSTSGDAVATVRADREFLAVALCNLLDNAVSYAPPGSVITLRTISREGTRAIEIANSGHGLSADDLPALLQRFVRKDSSRSATGTHAGLGLSICQRMLALQAMTLSLRLEEEWFVARVEMPLG